jgi:hypothetical protein
MRLASLAWLESVAVLQLSNAEFFPAISLCRETSWNTSGDGSHLFQPYPKLLEVTIDYSVDSSHNLLAPFSSYLAPCCADITRAPGTFVSSTLHLQLNQFLLT